MEDIKIEFQKLFETRKKQKDFLIFSETNEKNKIIQESTFLFCTEKNQK